MKKKVIIFLLFFCGILLTTILFSQLTYAESSSVSSSLISSYSIPFSNGNPEHLIVEDDGPPAKLWFTMPDADAIGQLVVTSTVDFQFRSFSVSANSDLYDLVYDAANGKVWFTENAANKIGRIDVNTKLVDEYDVTGGNGPKGIDIAPNGLIWFTQDTGNKVTSFDGGITFTDYLFPTANGGLTDIEAFKNDEIWFIATTAHELVRLKPSADEFSSNAVQTLPMQPTFAPGNMTMDANLPWVSAPTEGLIGRFAPGTASLWRWYDVSSVVSSPTAVYFHEEGTQLQIWFADSANGKAGQLYTDTNGNLQFLAALNLPGNNARPTDIQVSVNGTAWIADANNSTIVQWEAPYYMKVFLPVLLNPIMN